MSKQLDSKFSKRPRDTDFKQQRLRAWQPIVTVGSLFPIMLAIGVSFIPIGICLIVTSNSINEFELDYTDENCKSINADQMNISCVEFIKTNVGNICSCYIEFTLTDDMRGDVYMYYGLTNYHQNHRRYVKSRDDRQLLGIQLEFNDISLDCLPYRGIMNSSLQNSGPSYIPCGIMANSIFNDTFELYLERNKSSIRVNLLNTNIAWTTDRGSKFKNPSDFIQNPAKAFKNTVRPPNWQKSIYELDPTNANNNGLENEDLMVWMRTAAFSNFRKLYRRVDKNIPDFEDGLPSGVYKLLINYAYPTWSYGGRKLFLLTTTSWMGGKNPFLGIAYILVGCLCLLLSIVFICVHFKLEKRNCNGASNECTSL